MKFYFDFHKKYYPPVTFICLGTNFSSFFLSITKSCPLGFLDIASYIVSFNRSSFLLFLKNEYLNLVITMLIGIMMISKIPTISIKKIQINQRYKTWIFLIFVIVCVALISKIWLTLVTVLSLYLLSIIYTVFKTR